jgi:DNA-directed RNA polymerase specialized sigma24 family protein
MGDTPTVLAGAAGEPAAREPAGALDARFRRALMKFFMRRVRNAPEAEDLTQEVFARALRSGELSRLERPDSFVFTVATNLLRDRYRLAVRRAGSTAQAFVMETPDPVEDRGPERVVFASRVAAATRRAAATAAAPKVPKPTSSATPLILTPTTPPDWTLSGLFAHPRASFGTLQSKDGHSITSKRNDTPGVVLSNQLFVVSVQSGVVRRLTRDDRNYFNPQWSADGQSIVAAATGASGPIFGSAGIGIVSINPDGDRVQALSRGKGVSSRPSWAPDGRRLAYFDSETFVGRPAVRVEQAGVASPRDVTAALDRQVDDFVWSGDGQAIFVSYQDGLSEALARIALPAVTVEKLVPAGDHELPVDVSGLTASRAGALAWVQEDPMHPSSIQLLAPGAARPITLVDLHPQTRHWRLGTVKVIHWRNGPQRLGRDAR